MNKKAREWLESLLLSAIIIAVLFVVFWPFAITGDSMEPSFFDRDRIAISRLITRLGKISAGDFVVCTLMRDGKKEYAMKRVVGVPGERVHITGGKVYIDGEPLLEDYLGNAYTVGETLLTLGNDEYFVLGDNRDVSYDSRSAGPVKTGDMVGKVLIRWYPFNAMAVYGF